MTADLWVSVDQIGEHMGVIRDPTYRWIDRTGLPQHRIGRLWKFAVSEADDWVRAGCEVEVGDHGGHLTWAARSIFFLVAVEAMHSAFWAWIYDDSRKPN